MIPIPSITQLSYLIPQSAESTNKPTLIGPILALNINERFYEQGLD